jgi:hypothetical protein
LQRLLFRSLDALVDTSVLERRAFNITFAESGLDWTWGHAEYISLKKIVGERHRIAWYAEHTLGYPISVGEADKIQWKKEQALYRLLRYDFAAPCPGVLRLLDEAASSDIQSTLMIPKIRDWEILSRTVHRFKPLSLVKVERPSTYRAHAGHDVLESIEFNTTPMTENLCQGLDLPCVSVTSSVTGAQACVTHLGEANCPAVQLSGQNILHHGCASLRSLLTLESSNGPVAQQNYMAYPTR